MEISPDYIGFYLQVGISPILYLYIYIYIQPIIVEYLNIGIYRNMPNYIRNGIAVHSGTCADMGAVEVNLHSYHRTAGLFFWTSRERSCFETPNTRFQIQKLKQTSMSL